MVSSHDSRLDDTISNWPSFSLLFSLSLSLGWNGYDCIDPEHSHQSFSSFGSSSSSSVTSGEVTADSTTTALESQGSNIIVIGTVRQTGVILC